MKNATATWLAFLLLIIMISSCRKFQIEPVVQPDESMSATIYNESQVGSGPCIEDVDNGAGYDTILRPTILGYHLINHPYSLSHMQQAYTNLYGNAVGVGITHKYVRFKPSTPDQLSLLEDLDIDLFDYPLDYDVLQHGDYYDDGITPAEEIPWLYAVIDINATPPPGIAYEEIEQIHVPNLAVIENEAFSITGNPIDDYDCGLVESRVPLCAEGYHWDGVDCVADNCPEGYHWNGSQCVQNPPPPPPSVRLPSGTIRVDDNILGLRGVRNARVVAKRFLKVERTYTDNQGQYFIHKEFNKVHILVRFKNDQAKIRALRQARLWQILFPVERNLGKFKGSLNNVQHLIMFNADAMSDGARDWAAATAHNNVQEYRDFASQENIGIPPNRLRILLTNWRSQGVAGAAPMFAKRFWQTLPGDFLTFYVVASTTQFAGGLTALALVLKAEIDVTVGYNTANNNLSARSDQLSEVMFHELTHAAHYNKVGNQWWSDFVNAEVGEIIAGPAPYGTGTTGNSPIIALGESWAYHMGHFMADLKYGANSAPAFEQSFEYRNGIIRQFDAPVAFTGLNAHINLLEDFSPLRNFDPFRWIPQGLYNDLIDNRNDIGAIPQRVPLDDNVNNYTNQQFFNALDSDIATLPDYMLRLLNENGNNQAADVNLIFNFYEQ